MSATAERAETVGELKLKVRELEGLMVELGRETTDAMLEAWKSRIDSLRVQANLGRMELRDETVDSVDAAETAWHAARTRMEAVSSEASDVGTALMEGLRSARAELRAAVELAQDRVDEGRKLAAG